MIEFVLFLIPGAITYLIANAFEKTKKKDGFQEVMSFLVYIALNIGITWYLLHKDGRISEWIISSEDGYFLTYTMNNFLLAAAVAIVLGIIILLIKKCKVEITSREDAFYLKLSDKNKKIFKALLVFIVFLATVIIVVKPRIDNMLAKNRMMAFKSQAIELLESIKEEADNKLAKGDIPEEFEDLEVNHVIAKRVTSDQSWTTKSPTGKEEAVYMLDQNGWIVYISFRNKYYVATWSGPTEDPEFLQKNGNWNNGNGYGWSGDI